MPQSSESGRSGARSPKGLILEAVVIVLSILAAFAVDAGWNGYLERQQLRESLEEIASQLDQNRSEIARAIEQNEAVVVALDSFLETPAAVLPGLSGDSADALIPRMFVATAYDQNGGFVEGFVRDGRISLIADPRLRAGLLFWSSLEDELEEDFDAITLLDPLIAGVLARHGVVASVALHDAGGPGEALGRLRGDTEAVDLLARRRVVILSYIRNLRSVLDGFDALEQLLGESVSGAKSRGDGL